MNDVVAAFPPTADAPVGHATRMDDIEFKVATFASRIVAHPRYRVCFEAISLMHRASKFNRSKARAMLICGLSGMGKSTVAREFARAHPSFEAADRTIVPVLYVELPSHPTAKATATAILEALGDRMAHVGSAEMKQARVRVLFQECGVELLILDEMQHLTENLKGVARRIAADAVKNLLNTTCVPCVFIGAPVCADYLVSNQELSRRCSPKIHIAPFSIGTSEQAKEFKSMLVSLKNVLPVDGPCALVDPALVPRLFTATFGLLGVLTQLIEEALRITLVEGKSSFSREALRVAFERVVYLDCPPRRNPFSEEFDGRALTGRGEPYEGFAGAL